MTVSQAAKAPATSVTLAASAGFDPYGLPAVLQVLRDATPDNPVFSLSLSTHPPAQLRIDQMALAMGERLDGLSGKAAVTPAQRMEQLAARQRDQASAAAPAPASKPPAAVRLPVPKARTTKP